MTRSHRGRAAAVLALALGVVAVLAVIGLRVEDHLKPSTLRVEGTPFAYGEDLRRSGFGEDGTAPILVKAKAPGEAERVARRLADRLERHRNIDVLTPWDLPKAQRDQLLPRPGAVVIVPQIVVERDSFDWVMPYLYRELDRTVPATADAHITGIMAFGNGFEKESLDAAARAEKIAFPALVLILLLVFRSPIAAVIPLLLGGFALLSGRGLVRMFAEVQPLDAGAVSTVSMMSLALGVDYGLLMVSRFREERREGAEVVEAAAIARRTAGTTVLFASVTLLLAMLLAAVTAPGDLLMSLVSGTIAAVIVSAALALVTVPAALVLVGGSLERWRIPMPGWPAGARRRTRLRPALVASLVFVLLVLLAVPSLALESGPVDPRQLPESSRARADYDVFARTLGPGWSSSFEIVVQSRKGPITEAEVLRTVERYKRSLEQTDGVRRVFGVDGLDEAARGVRRTPGSLRRLREGLSGGSGDAGRLADGLRAASDGVGTLRDGVDEASGGAARLASGASEARAGGERLLEGTREAEAGAERLTRGTGTAARQLRREAVPGAEKLADGLRRGGGDLGKLAEPAGIVEERLAAAYAELQGMTAGKADPRYAAALRAVAEASAAASGKNPVTGEPVREGYEGLRASLDQGAAQVSAAANGADQLARGLTRGASALDRLRAGQAELLTGLGRLRQGVDELTVGAGRLADGGDRLADGLAEGARRSAPLVSGLGAAASGAGRSAGELGRASEQVAAQERQARDLFSSGFAVLAALDRATTASQRRAIGTTISLERGGRAVRMLVIPTTGPNEPETARLHDALLASGADLERSAPVDVGVSGTGAELATFKEEVQASFPLLVVLLSVATWFVLIVLFRSVLLPAVAVALNLLTVGAAFGLLALLFEAPGNILGDAGFLDAISATAIFVITFGLSIDYEVFLLSRMREGYLKTGDTEGAIQYGVQRTAGVIAGAAVIMTAVFLAFAASGVANLRQMGIGLATAVLLDATVVRLVVLPAAMRLLGEWNWWMPAWLDRVLPRVDLKH